jgi:uncharacterized protein YndB with AHSA1/START domain
MPDILHRISIDAPQERVYDLIATTEGVARWWTGRQVSGESSVGSRFSVYFGDADKAAAVMEVTSDKPDEVAWRVVDGPGPWIGTLITFDLRPAGSGGTTLLFSHAGWAEASELMGGCTTNWGAYLTSLKTGAEGLGFRPFPGGEISRWE